jgi:hypothetical protein
MSTSLIPTQRPLGLFELDAEGTILFSRLEPDGRSGDGRGAELAGRNFYEEVAAFENADELRRRIKGFLRGGGQADSFDFTSRSGGEAVPLRVLLARVRERSDGGRTAALILHLRCAR